MSILDTLNILSDISSKKEKEATLKKEIDNTLLKRVLYLCLSKRIKFYINAIPEYKKPTIEKYNLEEALDELNPIIERDIVGNAAKEHLSGILSNVSDDNAIVIKRIIDGDMKIGMGARSVNACFPKHIEITPYMGAVSFNKTKVDKIIDSGFAISQEKIDGRYANIIFDEEGSVTLESRQGERTYVKGKFLKSLEESCLSGIVLNGELTMKGVDRYTSNGMISSIVSIRGKEAEGISTDKEKKKFSEKMGMTIDEAEDLLEYTAWDSILLEEYYDNKSSVIYKDRLKNTSSYIDIINHEQGDCSIKLIDTDKVDSYSDAVILFQDKIKSGKEGTLVKSLNSTWKHGKPAWQVKMKLEMNVDLKIVGFNEGGAGTKNEGGIGSIRCESSDGLVKTDPYGISDDDAEMFNKDRESFIGKIVELKCCGLSHNSKGEYSLLHPSFVKVRDDKYDADTLVDIKENEAMIKGLSFNKDTLKR